jgi:hypothetical protein
MPEFSAVFFLMFSIITGENKKRDWALSVIGQSSADIESSADKDIMLLIHFLHLIEVNVKKSGDNKTNNVFIYTVVNLYIFKKLIKSFYLENMKFSQVR